MVGEIMKFLATCGPPYDEYNALVEISVAHSLYCKQYVMKKTENGIQYFCCYWKIKPEDIGIVSGGGVPSNVTDGSVLYVVEFGNKAGIEGVIEVREELRKRAADCTGVFWHRYGKGLRVFRLKKE